MLENWVLSDEEKKDLESVPKSLAELQEGDFSGMVYYCPNCKITVFSDKFVKRCKVCGGVLK